MAFLSFPNGWRWGIFRDAPPPPPESVRTFARSLARSVVRWRHNQIFSAWWVTNFSYPWCFAGALRALKLRYDFKNRTSLIIFKHPTRMFRYIKQGCGEARIKHRQTLHLFWWLCCYLWSSSLYLSTRLSYFLNSCVNVFSLLIALSWQLSLNACKIVCPIAFFSLRAFSSSERLGILLVGQN